LPTIDDGIWEIASFVLGEAFGSKLIIVLFTSVGKLAKRQHAHHVRIVAQVDVVPWVALSVTGHVNQGSHGM